MPGSCPILCFNSGSSSLKFALYQMGDKEEKLLAEGAVERIGLPDGRLWIRSAEKVTPADVHSDFIEYKAAVHAIFDALEKSALLHPTALGHRIVHGGPDYTAPVKIDLCLLDTLRRLIPFAPLHLPREILCIEAAAERFPELPQVACFDTGFHRSMPELAQRFPLPRYLWDEGVRHYGFHGLSYEYILSVLGAAVKGRVIIAHLGNGASMVAVRNGQSLDTTMGFSPAGGFMMGSRSGDLDPGIFLYLMNEKGYDSARIDQLVNHQAGLLGVSNISSDMKTLLDKRKSEPHADQAIEMFCYQIRKQVGALAAVLGGIDTLVFTGGIGENAAPVRWSICQGLEYLDVRLDPEQNAIHADTISIQGSHCAVKVVPTNEDLIIARHTRKLIS
jgi:acetate kinase